MTENDIKELISKNFIRTLANRQGYKVGEVELDHGVDLKLTEVTTRNNNDGSLRFIDSGKNIELQLKSTTEGSVKYTSDSVKYTLEAKTFNDLIFRRSSASPLFLILFILPNNVEKWVECNETMLKVEKHAYWYLPKTSDKQSDNTNSITINLSKSNLIQIETFEELFEIAYS